MKKNVQPEIASFKVSELTSEISVKCTDCMKCVNECGFLERYGSPGKIAGQINDGDNDSLKISYECSLCGLCNAVCPVGIDPSEMFLEMRREAVKLELAPFKEHSTILSYERKGTSKLYSFYSIPENCDSVFFPGCALTGTRPETTLKVFELLRKNAPNTGIVLDCCCKPSHDLGRQDYFEAMLKEMKEYLLSSGIRKIITACPNCHKVFSRYGAPLEVESVYQIFSELGPAPSNLSQDIDHTVHDPCVLRDFPEIQDSVRKIAEKYGCRLSEMKHSRQKTFCCGEGGSVCFVDKGLADSWKMRRCAESGQKSIITYCAGCASRLGTASKATHILDFITDPEKAAKGEIRASRPPFTYFNRLKVKNSLKKDARSNITRERTFKAEKVPKKNGLKALAAFSLIIIIAFLFKHFEISDYLNQDTIRSWVSSWGIWAPLFYVLLYSIAPALFFPALPITIAGGILFGPFWGVVYAITGATIGSCLPFLIARYAAREWVAGLIKGQKWKNLDDGTAKNGWKIVAFTRLIPLFPYNLLNYGLGLTKIGFFEYAITSFVCMLPACIGFIVFSSSLPDLLKGKISPGLIAGIAIIIAVSLIPFAYGKINKKKGMKQDASDNDNGV